MVVVVDEDEEEEQKEEEGILIHVEKRIQTRERE